jgi:hypothetical protein
MVIPDVIKLLHRAEEAEKKAEARRSAASCSPSSEVDTAPEQWRSQCLVARIQRDTAYASLREMIDLNEATGDPDPEITDRARALLPERLSGGTPITTMNTPTNSEALPLTICSAFADWYLAQVGITLEDAKRGGVTDLGILQDAYNEGRSVSPNYSDHLITALRCLDDVGLQLLTVELAKRIGGKAGNRGMCLRHHEWDRTTISGMTCSHCKETTDTAHFIYEPNVKEHATLSAGASVDHGVEVKAKIGHTNRAADRGCVSRLVVLSFLFALGVVLMVSSLGLMLLSDCLGSWAFYASCPLLAIGGIMTMLTGIHWPPRESKKSHEL